MAAGCAPPEALGPPRITFPLAGETALLLPGLPATEQELPLEAESSAASGRLSWFVDGAFLGSVGTHERLWWTPEAGVHELLVMDERGSSDRVIFEVRAGG